MVVRNSREFGVWENHCINRIWKAGQNAETNSLIQSFIILMLRHDFFNLMIEKKAVTLSP